MADIGAIVLHKVLKEQSLDGWSRLKLSFFNAAYAGVYSAVTKYYNRYNRIPDFPELDLYIRDPRIKENISALSSLEIPEIDLDVAIDSLVNEYTQNEALIEIDKFVDNVTMMESQEVKDSLSSIVMNLDEKTHSNSNVVNADNINIFEVKENIEHTYVPLGISNTFDAQQGFYRSEYFVLGGKRGHGKSVVMSNISVNQYKQGYIGAYFTIEMRAHEIFRRHMSIMARVPATALKSNNLTWDQITAIAKVRAEMFDKGIEEYEKFLEYKDQIKFEAILRKNYRLKENNQIIIIDDPVMSITSIDVHLQKLKARFGDKLRVAAIDYINQINVPEIRGQQQDKYDWKAQIMISSKLKELGSKYDIGIVSAFQIDEAGGTRFSKGILDSPDFAYTLDANKKEDGALTFENTKVRSGPTIDFTVPIDWDTLEIHSTDIPKPSKAKVKKGKDSEEASEEPHDNLPF
jgi:replicative DNA helicase